MIYDDSVHEVLLRIQIMLNHDLAKLDARLNPFANFGVY